MNDISPQRLTAAMSAAMQLKAKYEGADEELAALLDAETEAMSLFDRLGERAIADKLLAEVISERAKRYEARADRARAVLAQMMEALDMRKVERPAFTASMQNNARQAVITDPDAVATAYLRPDKVEIGKALRAGGTIDGCELSNATTSLRLVTR